MPGRLIPIVTNEIYHVFNRGIDRRPTFTTKREYQRAIETIKFYRFKNPPVRLSKFLQLEEKRQASLASTLNTNDKLIEMFSFCLMPNHFHFLLKQKQDHGISKFLSNFQNSYTRYFNTRHQRDGSLFMDQFKAVRIETDQQFIHVSRYIHLNPYASFVVKTINELENYPWSSLPSYLKKTNVFIEINTILSYFRGANDYKQFVFDRSDYQRRLKEIEHLIFE